MVKHGLVRRQAEPVRQIGVARMLQRRFEKIIPYRRHRIANEAGESIHAKIQLAKHTARGFRNQQNFIRAIYFHCGVLDIAPLSTQ